MQVSVTLTRTPGSSRLLLNGFTLDCQYSPGAGGGSNAKDEWKTYGGSITLGPKLQGRPVGLNIKGTEYNYNVPYGIHVATTYKNGGGPVRMPVYMYVGNARSVNLKAGDPLGTIKLNQTSNANAGIPDPSFDLYAANDLSADLSTCTINGNVPIVVNFNTVDLHKIGESVSSTQTRANVRLNYSCTEAGFTLPIKITLSGGSAGFNSGVLAMSNSNLGTGVLRGSTQINPGSSFNTTINNSSGSDNLTFALIRKASSTPATGAFSGSATLVLGYQ